MENKQETTFQPRFTAIVLAADRNPDDPVARAAGSCCKALAPVGGVPMVQRVLGALEESQEVQERVLCGPPESVIAGQPGFRYWLATRHVEWLPPEATPSTSALAGMAHIAPGIPVLLTTADHALLKPAIVDHFCREARLSGCEALVGLAHHARVIEAYPGIRRTVIRLRGGAYCGCNLFAFMTPAARQVAEFWRRVERQRKKPLRVIGAVGWRAVLRFLLGRLSLAEALERLSGRVGIRVGAVLLPFPEAAVDVDTTADWEFAASRTPDEGPHPPIAPEAPRNR